MVMHKQLIRIRCDNPEKGIIHHWKYITRTVRDVEKEISYILWRGYKWRVTCKYDNSWELEYVL